MTDDSFPDYGSLILGIEGIPEDSLVCSALIQNSGWDSRLICRIKCSFA